MTDKEKQTGHRRDNAREWTPGRKQEERGYTAESPIPLDASDLTPPTEGTGVDRPEKKPESNDKH